MHKTKMILYAEDNKLINLLTTRYLQEEGYEVISTYNGEEALETVKRYGNDLVCIVLDNDMPKLTGLEVAIETRKILGDINIILATGDDLTESEFKGAGINHYLEKPYDIDELLELINKKKEI
ncbi:response regulator [Candidatus Gracilibacteria bacterium]|nr:response regulator [Candidatus Gracilibacteria bacterium]